MGQYGITGWSAGGRRPLNYGLKAGQFRGMGRVNYYGSKTTIINNNFFGVRPMAPGPNFATMNYCENTGLSKGEKWLLGLGAGTSLLGTILGFFGLGGNKSAEGAGSAPSNETQTSNTPAPKVETPVAKKTTQPEVTTTPEETEEPAKENKTDFSGIKNGAHMVCRDASGRTSNISGTLSNVQTDANGVPTSFTLTDETSGNQYNYTVQVDSEGNVTYQCTSKNGQATVGAPAYTFQNGELVNLEGQNGYGIGIRTAQTQGGTSTKRTATTQTQQNTTTETGVPYKNPTNIDTISDPALRGSARQVSDTIARLPKEQQTQFQSQFDQILSDFNNSSDYGDKIQTGQKLVGLLNNIKKSLSPQQNTANQNTTTAADTLNNPEFWERQNGYGM